MPTGPTRCSSPDFSTERFFRACTICRRAEPCRQLYMHAAQYTFGKSIRTLRRYGICACDSFLYLSYLSTRDMESIIIASIRSLVLASLSDSQPLSLLAFHLHQLLNYLSTTRSIKFYHPSNLNHNVHQNHHLRCSPHCRRCSSSPG